MEQLGALAALGAAALWTVNGVVTERKGIGLEGSALNFGRILLGLLVITLTALAFSGGILPLQASAGSLLWLLLSGLVGFALGDTWLVKGFQTIGARLTLLVFSFAPVLTAVLSYLIFGERLSALNLLGMALVMLGIAMVIGFKAEGRRSAEWGKGLLYAFLASLAQAVGTISSKFGLMGMDALFATQVRLIGGALGMAILFLLHRRWGKLREVFRSANGRLTMLSGAVLGTLFGVVLSMVAIQHTKAAVASTLMATMPVLILPISYLNLKEKLRTKDLLGALISVIGSAILFL